MPDSYRKTTQTLLPARREPAPAGQYDIYPSFPLGAGRILSGFDALAGRLAGASCAVLDGFAGTLWEPFRAGLDAALRRLGVAAAWVCVDAALLPPSEIERLVEPFLGGDDPLFGTRFTGSLSDFFDPQALSALRPDPSSRLTILYGCGAALAGWDGLRIYLDLPKNELQFRTRAGLPTNLALPQPLPPKPAYKRSYFVDWPALNAHKAALLPSLDVLVDAQRPDQPLFISGSDFRAALERMSLNFFRVRPWFEPGPWGGQWIKERIPQLAEAPNYAWSFELIVPENGLVFESSGWLLEASFDWLMAQAAPAVLGGAFERFGLEFPIRFDFLDTVRGGNLSIQCHPRPEYIRHHFGECFTQDETYYILDCAPDAQVYLGFQSDIEPGEFRAALERSHADASPLNVDRFVQRHPAACHDLFLIPSGTIHGAGQGNLVLEISATPYIFTFKMYDWLRPDLDDKPRPLNIARAFDNLYFERQGARVREELISHPVLLSSGPGWQVIHLPTHPAQFFDVHRLEFERSIEVETLGQAHVLSLVEGSAIALETGQGMRQRFHFAETFVVPAAARRYRLVNEGAGHVRVVKAFVRPDASKEG